MIDKIKLLSKIYNIDQIGFSSHEMSENVSQFIGEKVGPELQGELMHYMWRSDCSPLEVFPEAKSMIVVLETYNNREKSGYNKDMGHISKSSHGLDYHKVLVEKMNKFSMALKADFDIESKCLVDINPLNERYYAVKAGLGQIGRNNCFYSYENGSFVFIGLILVDRVIQLFDGESNEPDNIMMRACENCLICRQACPGQAIKAYDLDVSSCIAFNNISKKNLNKQILPGFGNKVYGCDTCQDVCPVNKAFDHKKEYFEGREEDRYPDLVKLLSLTKSEFKDQYHDQALFWRGKNIIQRNAMIALLNVNGLAWFEDQVENGHIVLSKQKKELLDSLKNYYLK